MTGRREFMMGAALAGAGALVGGCAGPRAQGSAPALAGNFAWGALLELGCNMWGDWTPFGKYPQSKEEAEALMGKAVFNELGHWSNWKPGNYFGTDVPVWNAVTEDMSREGLNLVIIDVAEAYRYPSHPELGANGSWSPERMNEEVRRLRGLGLEPVPKLNFSAGHDQWLRQYHYMTSTPQYYKVVADLIRDVAEVFERPRYIHIGYDEETDRCASLRKMGVVRHGEQFWYDFNKCVREVERTGARAIAWSDRACYNRADFLKNMSKDVVQMPWYYGSDFSDETMAWKPGCEGMPTATDLKPYKNLAAHTPLVSDLGFDMIGCTSNWEGTTATDAFVAYCKRRLDPKHLLGIITAPWAKTVERQREWILQSIRLLGAAKRKHYA